MSQRRWTKIASQRGTITHLARMMIYNHHTASDTARDNPSVDNVTDTDQRHTSLLQRLSALAATARSIYSSTRDTNDISAPLQASEPSNDNTQQFQPPLISASQITPAQRLSIARAEWNKILSQRGTIPTMRQSILSSENLRGNNPWGDRVENEGDNVTRIYSLNVNGLSIDRRGGRFDDLCKVGKEVQADIICCQEHNLDTTRFHATTGCLVVKNTVVLCSRRCRSAGIARMRLVNIGTTMSLVRFEILIVSVLHLYMSSVIIGEQIIVIFFSSLFRICASSLNLAISLLCPTLEQEQEQ